MSTATDLVQAINTPPARIESGMETAAGTALAAQATAMVQSRYLMALKRPRDWDQVRSELVHECKRPAFANDKSALYNKPIGDGVEGLGIRFVEVAIRCMKNVLCESYMVYEDPALELHRVVVTDLESNATHYQDVPVQKTVERSKPMDDGTYISVRKNSYGRSVYTVPANSDDLLNKRGALISKALRTVGLRIIPGYLQEEAESIIRQVRKDKAAADPDAERRNIIDAFEVLNIGPEQLTEYLGHALDVSTPAELVKLRGLYGALRDGEATWATVMDNLAEQRVAKKKEAKGADAELDRMKKEAAEKAAKDAKDAKAKMDAMKAEEAALTKKVGDATQT